MNPTSKLCCRIVGVIGFLCMAFCLIYVTMTSVGMADSTIRSKLLPTTPNWWMLFSCLSVAVGLGVALGSYHLLYLRKRGARIIVLWSLVPMLIEQLLPLLAAWDIGAAQATGVGLAGMLAMNYCLLPVLAALIWLFCSSSPTASNSIA